MAHSEQVFTSGSGGPEEGQSVVDLRPDQRSVQEKVPDARGLDPGDVGGRAGEHAGLVLHGAADGAEAHHAMDLPAVPPQLAQQRTPGVPLEQTRRC